MSWCPACGMDGFSRTVHDTDPYRGEYEQATCSYCGYQDEAEWLPEGWDEQEDDESYPFCDCTECPCNVPVDDDSELCEDCRMGNHMDSEGRRKS